MPDGRGRVNAFHGTIYAWSRGFMRHQRSFSGVADDSASTIHFSWRRTWGSPVIRPVSISPFDPFIPMVKAAKFRGFEQSRRVCAPKALRILISLGRHRRRVGDNTKSPHGEHKECNLLTSKNGHQLDPIVTLRLNDKLLLDHGCAPVMNIRRNVGSRDGDARGYKRPLESKGRGRAGVVAQAAPEVALHVEPRIARVLRIENARAGAHRPLRTGAPGDARRGAKLV